MPLAPKKVIDGRYHFLFGKNLEAAKQFIDYLHYDIGTSGLLVQAGDFYRVTVC